LERLDEARAIVARLRAISPLVLPDDLPFRNPEDRELLLSGLRLAAGEATWARPAVAPPILVADVCEESAFIPSRASIIKTLRRGFEQMQSKPLQTDGASRISGDVALPEGKLGLKQRLLMK
jgi:hypothetical protein